jgi:hypothetical protein
VLLAVTVVVCALTQADTAEIEAKHGNAEGDQRLHGVVNDLVVHGSPSGRVWMTDQRHHWRILGASVEKGFEAAGWPVEVVDGADLGGEALHSSSVMARPSRLYALRGMLLLA